MNTKTDQVKKIADAASILTSVKEMDYRKDELERMKRFVVDNSVDGLFRITPAQIPERFFVGDPFMLEVPEAYIIEYIDGLLSSIQISRATELEKYNG